MSVLLPIPPPPSPRIGWFDYEGNTQTGFYTVLHPVGNYITPNDLLIAIDPVTNGISTYYFAGQTPVTNAPQFSPPPYQDGLTFVQPLLLDLATLTTNGALTIKAMNVGPGGTSAVVTAQFIFQAGNPIITGNNAAQFTISDVTTNVVYWYTLDGSDPTNAAPNQRIPSTNGAPVTLSIDGSTNVFFQVRAVRNGYQTSGISSRIFLLVLCQIASVSVLRLAKRPVILWLPRAKSSMHLLPYHPCRMQLSIVCNLT